MSDCKGHTQLDFVEDKCWQKPFSFIFPAKILTSPVTNSSTKGSAFFKYAKFPSFDNKYKKKIQFFLLYYFILVYSRSQREKSPAGMIPFTCVILSSLREFMFLYWLYLVIGVYVNTSGFVYIFDLFL